jgi:hypothetical protein
MGTQIAAVKPGGSNPGCLALRLGDKFDFYVEDADCPILDRQMLYLCARLVLGCNLFGRISRILTLQ